MDNEVIESPAQPVQAAAPMPAVAQQQRPLTIVESAARSGATPEQLVQLFQLQRDADNHQLELMREKRRMDKEDREAAGLLAFRRDFAAFRGENIIIAKSKFVDRGKAGSFMQAEYHAASNLLSPALSRHGFSFRHNEVFGAKRWMSDGVESDIPWVYVTCYLEHRDGHAETLDLEGPPGDMTANTPVQNMQVTASYLKRQSLLAITGTATGGEDDENGMRGKFKRREPDSDAGGADESEVLIDAGRAEAMKGMVALNKWWATLTPRQQKDMGQDFGPMRKAARLVDEGAPK